MLFSFLPEKCLWNVETLRVLYPKDFLNHSLFFLLSNQPCPLCRGYHTASHRSLPGQWQVTIYQAERENLLYPNWPAVFTHRSNMEKQIRIEISTSVSGTNATQMVPSPPWGPSSTKLPVVLARTFLQSYLLLRARRHHGLMLSSSCSEISPLFLLKDWLFWSEFNSVTPWFLISGSRGPPAKSASRKETAVDSSCAPYREC